MTGPDRSTTIVSTAPTSDRARRAFEELAGRRPNFEPVSFAEAERDPTWRVDTRSEPMPGEPPGPPVAGGPFLVARHALTGYEFADPRIVRAVYDSAQPLQGRDMLLVGRFLGLRFHMGVRVGGVVDGPDREEGAPVHRFAWHYRTLEGHLEQGQMSYELTKWPENGDIRFRIRAYSRRAPIPNPIVRLGFSVFGRNEQLRFHRRSFERLRCIVEERAVV